MYCKTCLCVNCVIQLRTKNQAHFNRQSEYPGFQFPSVRSKRQNQILRRVGSVQSTREGTFHLTDRRQYKTTGGLTHITVGGEKASNNQQFGRPDLYQLQ